MDATITVMNRPMQVEDSAEAIQAAVRSLRVVYRGIKGGTLLFQSVDHVSHNELDPLLDRISHALIQSNEPAIRAALDRVDSIGIVRNEPPTIS